MQSMSHPGALADLITVQGIAEENLRTCSPRDQVGVVLAEMEELDLDIYPVGENGAYSQFISRSTLREEPSNTTIGEVGCKDITVLDVIPIHSTLRDALELLVSRHWLFCIERNRVQGMITRGDLQRLPARTYFFALLTAFEALVLEVIRTSFPNDEWLTDPKVPVEIRSKAEREFDKRRATGEEPTSAVECLMLASKLTVLKHTELWEHQRRSLLAEQAASYISETPEDMLKKVRRFRNNLAHGDDLTAGLPRRWHDLLDCLRFVDAANSVFTLS